MVFQRQRLPESNNHFSEVKTVAFITRVGKLQLFFPAYLVAWALEYLGLQWLMENLKQIKD